MAAIIFFQVEMRPFLTPAHRVVGAYAEVWIRVAAVGIHVDALFAERFELFFGCDVEDVQLVGIELIARERVFGSVQNGAAYTATGRARRAGWRGLDPVDFFMVASREAEGDEGGGTGGPVETRV